MPDKNEPNSPLLSANKKIEQSNTTKANTSKKELTVDEQLEILARIAVNHLMKELRQGDSR